MPISVVIIPKTPNAKNRMKMELLFFIVMYASFYNYIYRKIEMLEQKKPPFMVIAGAEHSQQRL